MRVLVLGTSGVDRDAHISKVGSLLLQEKGFAPAFEVGDAPNLVRILCVEDVIKEVAGSGRGQPKTIIPFLDLQPRERQRRRWREAMEDILASLGNFGAGATSDEVVFLNAHGWYYRDRQLFSCLSWDLTRQFGPHAIVTLIDDAYDVRTRINDLELELDTRSQIDVGEVLSWRASEISLGDILAQNLYLNSRAFPQGSIPRRLRPLFRSQPLPHFVVAVKHPPETMFGLLFKPTSKLVVYASFPITATRTVPERVTELSSFRSDLRSRFTVLDPVTVDELRGDVGELHPRWPLGYSSVVSEVRDSLGVTERDAFMPVILAQLQERDFRLADTATCVAAYRPFWGARNEPAGGVEAELGRAFLVANEKVIYHHPDDGSLDELHNTLRRGIFDLIRRISAYDSYERFLAHLDRLQENLQNARN